MAELANRMEQEADFARRLSKLSSRHRKELIALLGTPPDISRVPQSFWIRVEKEHREELGIILALLFVAASDQHIDLLLPPDLRYTAMDATQDKADTWADSRATALSRKYAENSRRGLVRADRKWYGTKPRALGPNAPEVPPAEVFEKVVNIFGPARDARTATTETTRAATAGTKEATKAAEDLGVTTTITWITELDGRTCPICRPLHRVQMQDWESVGINAEISANGGPPAHDNCRCSLEIKRVKNLPESVRENCGIGSDGFEAGNTCATGGSASPKVQAWARKRFGDGTKAKAFSEWFGDSKVVGESGEPLVVYHGTEKVFDEFRFDVSAENPTSNNLVWFAHSPETVEGYGNAILPVNLAIKNPLVVDYFGAQYVGRPDKGDSRFVYDEDRLAGVLGAVDEDGNYDERWIAKLRKDGYDGIIVKNIDDRTQATRYDTDPQPGTIYAVFRPSQIKSATGNRGTFSPKSPKITEALAENCGTGAGGFQPGNDCAAGGGGSLGKSGAPEGKSKSRTAEVLANAQKLEFTDEVVFSDAIEDDDYEGIEATLSDDEKRRMSNYIDKTREEVVQDAVDNYDPDYDLDQDNYTIDDGDGNKEFDDDAYGRAQREMINDFRASAENDFDEDEPKHQWLEDLHASHRERFSVKAVPGKWGKAGDRGMAYVFNTPSGGRYDMWATGDNFHGIPVTTIGFRDAEGSYSVTGKEGPAGAVHVFRNATTAVTALALKTKPDYMTFTATEPSRQKLYDRLVRTTAAALPQYKAIALQQSGQRRYLLVHESKMRELRGKVLASGTDIQTETLVESQAELPTWTLLKPIVKDEWFTEAGWAEQKHSVQA